MTDFVSPVWKFRTPLVLRAAAVFAVAGSAAFALPAGTAAAGQAAAEIDRPARAFVKRQCAACHAGETVEGGFNLAKLGTNLNDAATFAKWERLFDRVDRGEMPPKDAEQPRPQARREFLRSAGAALTRVHARKKGTVLRRLNRREYENTLNDIFGTHLDLAGMLPEDGRAREFDNIGNALGLSIVHLRMYMDAAGSVFDAAVAKSTAKPQPATIEATYAKTREAERFVGRVWKKLRDNAIVRFSGGGYPSGMLRGSGVRQPGRYRIRVTGYAYQSQKPITFSVGGTSFRRGSEKPIYGFYSFPPGAPGRATTIELEAWIDRNYMIQIEPYGISDPRRYQRKSIDKYEGPGLAILKVELKGPLLGEFPSRGHRLVFDGITRREIPPRNPRDRKKRWYKPRFEIISKNESADAARSLRRVAAAAFRRPVTATDVTPYVSLFHRERNGGATFEESLRTAVVALFCSPRFLYLREPAGRLDQYALASRLSYFLTRSAPDETLLRLAAAGRLADDGVLRAQTERLLKAATFERALVDFTDNWLDLREMDFTMPDRSLFPEFDAYLRWSMPRETRAFLRELIEANLPVRNLVKSDFAMLNSRLAAHYGLPPVAGSRLRKVKLPPGSLRGGLLTQASILKVTANGTNTSPVKRGAWVLERILGETPQPPPPGIPGVEPDIRGATTLRQLLDKHRNVVSCRACHRKIDPPGFALESFNPIGGFRARYRSLGKGNRVQTMVNGRRVRYRLGPKVDSSGHLPGAGSFDGYAQFRDHLARDEDLLARTLARKLLTFATGRELGFSDRKEIDRIVKASANHKHGTRELIHLVVQSEIFRSK